jgi:hypothetical protein
MTSPAKRGVVLEERRVRAVLRRYLANALVERALEELRDADGDTAGSSSGAPAAPPPPPPPSDTDRAFARQLARRAGLHVRARR